MTIFIDMKAQVIFFYFIQIIVTYLFLSSHIFLT